MSEVKPFTDDEILAMSQTAFVDMSWGKVAMARLFTTIYAFKDRVKELEVDLELTVRALEAIAQSDEHGFVCVHSTFGFSSAEHVAKETLAKIKEML